MESEPSATVIVGPPGSGKSLLLWKLTTRVAQKRKDGRGNFTPLYIQCKSWRNDQKLHSWIVRESRSYFDIPGSLTREWLKSGSALLLLDGLDEVPHDNVSTLVTQLNQWFESPLGGRAVITCRTSRYFEAASTLQHSQVANLRPFTPQQVRHQLAQFVKHHFRERSSIETENFLDLLSHSPSDELRNPLTLQILRQSLELASDTNSEPIEETAKLIRSGDYLAQIGKSEAAVSNYLSAIRHAGSRWTPAAGMRASWILAEAGDEVGAREILHAAVTSHIENSFDTDVRPLEDQLSPDEKLVLDALRHDRAYDSSQIGSRSGLPPSRCKQALRRLRDRGLISVISDRRTEWPRFKRIELDRSTP